MKDKKVKIAFPKKQDTLTSEEVTQIYLQSVEPMDTFSETDVELSTKQQKDVDLLTNVLSKHTLLDNAISGISYNLNEIIQPDETEKYLESLAKYDQELEKGRSILIKLTKDNQQEIAEEYTEWENENNGVHGT